jgi:hypothetical protein
LNGEKTNVSRTISVLGLVLRVLKWLEFIHDTDGNYNHFSTLRTRTRTEMVLETLVFSSFSHLTRLVA